MFDPSRVRDTTTSTTVSTPGGGTTTVRTPSGVVSTLQDFFITFQSEYADVSIGQFKNTVSWEGYASAAKILMPERSFVGNLLGGQRDVGVRIDKTFKQGMYSLNLFNGAGQNNLDNNNQKDVSLRIEVYPVPGLTIAGSTYDSLGYRTRAGTKDRWEGDLRYEGGPFLFQSEYIYARDVFANDAAAIKAQGFYAAAAFKLGEIGSGDWKGVLQPVVRFGYYDPNTDVNLDPKTVPGSNFGGNDERMDYEVGLNYYLRAHEMKLQASYDRQQFDNSDAKPAVNEVIVAAQVWF
jgi:phosphate-selective porin